MYMEANKECKQINPERNRNFKYSHCRKIHQNSDIQDQNINEWTINKMYVQTESKQIKSKM